MGEEYQEAHRVYKRCKAGMYESVEELDARELGLLYLYYPDVLPDVEPGGAS